MKNFFYAILIIAGLVLLVFSANEFEIFGTKFWGVRKENARREVFEQTESYVSGRRKELIKLHHEWIKADSEDKEIIEGVIRTSFADFDETKIEELELRSFLKKIKYN